MRKVTHGYQRQSTCRAQRDILAALHVTMVKYLNPIKTILFSLCGHLSSWLSNFVNHLYDDRPNWTPLSPITIICNIIAVLYLQARIPEIDPDEPCIDRTGYEMAANLICHLDELELTNAQRSVVYCLGNVKY